MVEVNRGALLAQDTVTGALGLVIADRCADYAQWIIRKQFFTCFHKAVFLEKLDNVRNRSCDGTIALAHRCLAVEAALGLFLYL